MKSTTIGKTTLPMTSVSTMRPSELHLSSTSQLSTDDLESTTPGIPRVSYTTVTHVMTMGSPEAGGQSSATSP